MSISQMLTKIGLTAWQNWSDSKNWTDFAVLYKRSLRGMHTLGQESAVPIYV
jgi:hypothetical protein